MSVRQHLRPQEAISRALTSGVNALVKHRLLPTGSAVQRIEDRPARVRFARERLQRRCEPRTELIE
jgi:hypothetical protein